MPLNHPLWLPTRQFPENPINLMPYVFVFAQWPPSKELFLDNREWLNQRLDQPNKRTNSHTLGARLQKSMNNHRHPFHSPKNHTKTTNQPKPHLLDRLHIKEVFDHRYLLNKHWHPTVINIQPFQKGHLH